MSLRSRGVHNPAYKPAALLFQYHPRVRGESRGYVGAQIPRIAFFIV